MKKYKVLLVGFVLIAIVSCKHSVNFSDYPEVSFSNDVGPVIIGNCTQSGCHGVSGDRRKLVTYSDIASSQMVTPGSPSKSSLYKVISSLSKFNVMPVPPLAPLTDTQIEKIYLWIGQGAKNN
jgi:hypothetical protein